MGRLRWYGLLGRSVSLEVGLETCLVRSRYFVLIVQDVSS